jgi:hypothetical protein
MKTKNYLKKAILLFLVCFAQFISAQVPNYVPTNGLVAYYPFSGNANDVSGNANNGTNNGATLTTDRFGNTNSAYSFNGINNFISTNTSSILFPNGITFCAWIKPTVYKNASIVDKMLNSGSGFRINTRENSVSLGVTPKKIWSQCSYYGNTAGNNYTVSSTDQNLNNWQFVVGTFGSDGKLKLYYNGLLENQITTSYNVANNSPILIGRGSSAITYENFQGNIDDIGVWNRVLTQAEITAMYNGFAAYSDTCNAVSGSLTQGLVGYWPFCGNANDDSGNENNGVVNGATLTTDRFGNLDGAYSFNGTSNYIALPSGNSTSLNITGNFTASFWIKTSDLSAGLLSLGNNISSPYEGYLSGINAGNVGSGKLGVSTGGGVWTGSINTVSDNNWHNVTYVLNNNILKIYLDNVLNIQTTVNNIPLSWSGNRIIGCTNDLLLIPERLYNGIIDDIGIWNRALTQQEVTQLYNQNQCFTNTTVTDTLVINVGQLSYTNPIAYANNITIYPNPASTQVNIAFNNISNLNGGSIKIINSLGQQVATTPITTSGTNTTLTLSTWGGSGLYFVQIVNPQGQIVDIKKILLQ